MYILLNYFVLIIQHLQHVLRVSGSVRTTRHVFRTLRGAMEELTAEITQMNKTAQQVWLKSENFGHLKH